MAKKDLTAKGLVILIAAGAPEAHEGIIAQFLEEFKGVILVEADADIKSLEKKITEINLASKTEIERLSGELIIANTSIETLNNQLASAPSDTTIDLLTQERDAALGMVKDLSEQIALQSEIKDPNKVVVSIDGEKFFLQGGNFNVPGFGKLSLDELSKNEGALRVMKDRKSGSLTAVEK